MNGSDSLLKSSAEIWTECESISPTLWEFRPKSSVVPRQAILVVNEFIAEADRSWAISRAQSYHAKLHGMVADQGEAESRDDGDANCFTHVGELSSIVRDGTTSPESTKAPLTCHLPLKLVLRMLLEHRTSMDVVVWWLMLPSAKAEIVQKSDCALRIIHAMAQTKILGKIVRDSVLCTVLATASGLVCATRIQDACGCLGVGRSSSSEDWSSQECISPTLLQFVHGLTRACAEEGYMDGCAPSLWKTCYILQRNDKVAVSKRVCGKDDDDDDDNDADSSASSLDEDMNSNGVNQNAIRIGFCGAVFGCIDYICRKSKQCMPRAFANSGYGNLRSRNETVDHGQPTYCYLRPTKCDLPRSGGICIHHLEIVGSSQQAQHDYACAQSSNRRGLAEDLDTRELGGGGDANHMLNIDYEDVAIHQAIRHMKRNMDEHEQALRPGILVGL